MSLARMASASALAGGMAFSGAVPVLAATPEPNATALVTSTPANLPSATAGKVVLIGTSGLIWNDLSTDTPIASTPSLAAMVGRTALGSLSVRSVNATACPIDGWMAVSAGRRAAAPRTSKPAPGTPGCLPLSVASDTLVNAKTPGAPASVPDWASLTSTVAAQPYRAHLGLLGDTLHSANRRTAAIGPGAMLALSRSDGTTPQVWPGIPTGLDGGVDTLTAADVATTTVVDQLNQALPKADVIAIDLGSVLDAPLTRDPKSTGDVRPVQVKAIDERLGAILRAVPEGTTFIFASLGDSGTHPHLQVIVQGTPDQKRGGSLTSATTRQEGIVTTPDIMPTLLRATGVVPPTDVDGSAMRAHLGPEPSTKDTYGQTIDTLERQANLDDAAQVTHQVVQPVGLTLGLLTILALAGSIAGAYRHAAPRPARYRAQIWLQYLALWMASLPAASLLAGLVPWWSWGAPGVSLALVCTVLAALICASAVTPLWNRLLPVDPRTTSEVNAPTPAASLLWPSAVVAGISVLVIGGDVVTGSHLSLITSLGGDPLDGGRFAGMNNIPFAVYAVGIVVLIAGLAQLLLERHQARAAVVVSATLAIAALSVDAAPLWGADLGGTLALIPGLCWLVASIAKVHLTLRRWLAIGATTLMVTLLVCWLDWLRPADSRTHLGRFFGSVISGAGGSIVSRKADALAHGWGATIWTMLAPLVVLVFAWAIAQPHRVRWNALALAYNRIPLLRPAMMALGLIMALSVVTNDSGMNIPAVAGAMVVGLLLAVGIRCQAAEDQRLSDAAAAAVLRQTRKR